MEETSKLTNFFGWTLSILIVLNFVPYFGSSFSDCKSTGAISTLLLGRPVCIAGEIYGGFTSLSSGENKIQGDVIQNPQNSVKELNQGLPKTSMEDNESTQFNLEIFNKIEVQGKLVTEEYSYCINFIKDKTSKVNQVRDQGTLYQFDGDVKNCLNEYLIRAKTFTQLIQDNPEQITSQSREKVQSQILSQVKNLKSLSNNYIQLSSNRHYYIHQRYQVNSLMDLGKIIGETAGAIASEDPEGTINSLSNLYDWWYYNGGVIDTGWGL